MTNQYPSTCIRPRVGYTVAIRENKPTTRTHTHTMQTIIDATTETLASLAPLARPALILGSLLALVILPLLYFARSLGVC